MDDWCQWFADGPGDRICAAKATHLTNSNRRHPHWRRACDHHAEMARRGGYQVESRGADWVGDVYPVNADPAVDTWNGQPIQPGDRP